MMDSARFMELAAAWRITAAEGRFGRKFALMRIRAHKWLERGEETL
jgi:hypothetical protein